MIRTDLGIATAYAEAVSKGYTGTRDEFGQMFADFGKTAEKVTEDKKAVERMKASVEETKSSVDTTAAEFGQNVADKTAEAKAAITEHANTEKESATAAISEAKDAATGAITEAQTSATDAIASAKDLATAEIAKKGTDTLATIPDDYTALTKEVGSLKEDLSNKITKFYASNQGETHLSDSDNGKIMDMMLYGKSEQFTTIGKNLLKIKDGTRTIRGITTTTKDGVIKLKGTATDTGWALVDVDSFVLDGMCILSSNITDDVKVSVANKSFITVLVQGESATLKNAEVSYVCFSVTAGKTYDISNILAQIEKGSVATSYEPYTGGIPSPSPDYPQEIKSVVNPTIKVCGKNLLRQNIKFKEKVNIKKGTKLTLICKNGVVSNGGNLKFEKANGEPVWFGFDAGAVKQQIILKSDVVAYTYLFKSEPSESYALYIGDENTYEPYKEQSMQLNITLNAVPVSSGGNVTINGQQYIADYVDVERGKIVHNIGIANQEDFTVTQKDGQYVAFVNYTADTKGGIGSVTTITNGYSPSWEAIENISHHFTQSNSVQRLIIILAKGTTLERADEIKKNGFEFWYTLQTPIEEELTTEQVYALKELATRYPATNVSVTSEQLDGYTVFNYPISLANGWNYVKKQLNDNRDYIYDMDLQSAEAYVNSEYAVALTELEV